MSNSPLKLASLLEVEEMEVIKDCGFNCSPYLLVIELCFKGEVKSKFDNSVAADFACELNNGFLPF